MSEYRLYCVGESGNCYKVALMLNVCGCDWEPVFVDYFARRDARRRVPRLAQRARRSAGAGARRPQADPERRDPHLAGRPPRPLRRPRRARAAGDPALDAVRQSQVHQLLRDAALPERHREERRSGRASSSCAAVRSAPSRSSTSTSRSSRSCSAREPTIADFSLVGYQYYDEETAIDRDTFPHLLAWTRRIAQLPGWKHPYELMPRGSPDR